MDLDITDLRIFRTYGGCYEGLPERPIVIQTIGKTIERMWGSRPTYFHVDENSGERLPKWAWVGWVEGPAIDPNDDGTHLVVVWFSDLGPGVECELDDVLDDGTWKKHTVGFGY